MTVAELMIELKKLDQSTEVWVDTPDGLLPLEMVYKDNAVKETAVLVYADQFSDDNDPLFN